jgi:hypothetical protein
MGEIMQVFFGIAYLVIGLVQLFAIMDGVAHALSINKFFAALIALFLTYIPLVGSIAGVYGAVNVWDWGWLQAVVLFFWYVPVFLVFLLVGGAAELLDRSK